MTTATSTVGLALTTSGGASLTCTSTSVAAVSGVATFAGCKVDKATTYTLTATATGLTAGTSASFAITAGAASKVAFTTQPSAGTGGTALPTQPVVSVQDASGNTVTGSTSSVTLALTSAAGATLTCTTNPKAAVAGVAAFAGCKVDKAGTYTLTAAASGLTSGVSSGFTITAGAATQLVFTVAPATGVSRAASATTGPFTLQLQDANGNAVVAGAGGVTVALTSTTPSGGNTYFSATQNGTTLTSVTVPSGSSTVSFYFGYTKNAKPVISATASGLTVATAAVDF